MGQCPAACGVGLRPFFTTPLFAAGFFIAYWRMPRLKARVTRKGFLAGGGGIGMFRYVMVWSGTGRRVSMSSETGAVEAPDGHAGGGYAVLFAEVGAVLPAVAGAGWRVIEKEEEFVEEGDGTAIGVLGAEQSMLEGGEAGNCGRSFGGFGFVGFGKRSGGVEIHKAAILQRAGRNAVSLDGLDGLRWLKR